jgi:uncharacterized protein YegP (UPF0339 family)
VITRRGSEDPVTFKIRKNVRGEWYFSIVASNYRTLAHSEGYGNRSDAVSAAQLIISQAGSGTIEG